MAYYIKLKDKRPFGPFNEEKLKQMLATGRISYDTEVSTDKRNWQPLQGYPELVGQMPVFNPNQMRTSAAPTPAAVEQVNNPAPSYSPQPAANSGSFLSAITGLFRRNAPKNGYYTSNSNSRPVTSNVQVSYAPQASNYQSEGIGSIAIYALFFFIAILFGIVIFLSIQIYKLSDASFAESTEISSSDKTNDSSSADSSPTSNNSIIKRLAKVAPKSVVVIKTNQALGSGVVIARDDNSVLILTNRHVITEKDEDAKSKDKEVISNDVSVKICDAKDGQIRDETEKKAVVVATPSKEKIDLALVLVGDPDKQLQAQWKIAPLRAVEQGDSVYAIGHPVGFSFTITTGICSAKRNVITHWVVQHTASINHGNSGGPLLNSKGEIVGINTFGVEQEPIPPLYEKIIRSIDITDKEDYQLLIDFIKDVYELPRYNNLFFAMPADFIFDESQWTFHDNIKETKALLSKVQRAPKAAPKQ